MSWWKRKIPEIGGGVYFQGTLAPRAENYEDLRRKGIEIAPLPAGPTAHWKLELRHPTWGRAHLISLRESSLPPAELIDWDPRLGEEDRKNVKAAGASLMLILFP